MKLAKKLIVGILVLALLAFTAIFLANAYNSGKIGNKAEKKADKFIEMLYGEPWQGAYSISKLSFSEEGVLTLNVLGVSLDGTYTDTYSIENDVHTLTIKYTSFGISVERDYIATINDKGTKDISDDELTLVDKNIESVKMTYNRVLGDRAEKMTNATTDKAKTENIDNSTTKKNDNLSTDSPKLDSIKQEILGKWSSSQSQTSGYDFIDSSKVKIMILGVNTEGTYTLSYEENTQRTVISINYITVAGVSISNTYYVSVDDNSMTLTQKSVESLTTTYTRA